MADIDLDLSDHEVPHEKLVNWDDSAAEKDHSEHAASLGGCLKKIARSKTPQADYARAALTAELQRTKDALAKPRSVESEREAFRAAIAAFASFEARALPTDVDGEMRRLAERNVLGRALLGARAAFLAAARAAKLRRVSWNTFALADARSDTAALVKLAPKLELDGPLYESHAADVATAQGKAATPGRGIYFAVAEAEVEAAGDGSAEFQKLCEARFYFASRALGLAERPANLSWKAAS